MQAVRHAYPSFMEYTSANVALSAATGRHWVISALNGIRHSEAAEHGVNRDWIQIMNEVMDPQGQLSSDFYSMVFAPAMQKVIGGADSNVFLVVNNNIQTMCNTAWQAAVKSAAGDDDRFHDRFSVYSNADSFMTELNEDVKDTQYTLTMLDGNGTPVTKNIVRSFAKGEVILIPIQEPGHWLMTAVRLVSSRNEPHVRGVPAAETSESWKKGTPRIEIHVLNSMSGKGVRQYQTFCILSIVNALVRAAIRFRSTSSDRQAFPLINQLTMDVCTVIYDSRKGQSCQTGLEVGSGSICGVFVAAWIECMVRQMHMDIDGGPLQNVHKGMASSMSQLTENILKTKGIEPYGSNLLRYYYGLMTAYTLNTVPKTASPYSFNIDKLAQTYLSNTQVVVATNPPTEILMNVCIQHRSSLCRSLTLTDEDYEAFMEFRNELLRLAKSAKSKIAVMKAMQWHTQVVFTNHKLINNVTFVVSTLALTAGFRKSLPQAVVATNNFTFAVAVKGCQTAHRTEADSPSPTSLLPADVKALQAVGAGLGAQREEQDDMTPLRAGARAFTPIPEWHQMETHEASDAVAPVEPVLQVRSTSPPTYTSQQTQPTEIIAEEEEEEEEKEEKKEEEKEKEKQMEEEKEEQMEEEKEEQKEEEKEEQMEEEKEEGEEEKSEKEEEEVKETKEEQQAEKGVLVAELASDMEITEKEMHKFLSSLGIHVLQTDDGKLYITPSSHDDYRAICF